MYFSGVDGDADSLALIKQGTPYRASHAFAWPLMGYGMGRFTADWIDGKQIPRVMVANTTLLDSPAAVAAFQADNASPKRTFEDQQKYQRYFPLLGNVSFATRHDYWTEDYVPR
jgi:ribose transport system substrate-binding protein